MCQIHVFIYICAFVEIEMDDCWAAFFLLNVFSFFLPLEQSSDVMNGTTNPESFLGRGFNS